MKPWLENMLRAYFSGLIGRSALIGPFLQSRITAIGTAWIVIATLASIAKIATAPVPIHGWRDLFELALPYAAVVLAPIIGYALAASAYKSGQAHPPTAVRLAIFGKWHKLSRREAAANAVFGPAGFMASLLVGLLLNVVVRAWEFMVAIPAVNGHAPQWSATLFHVMAFDLASMSAIYMICFVMALRTVPLFPRMLLFSWLLDITLQLGIAHTLTSGAQLPIEVAKPLAELLQGNITKVLISAAVWLPYLTLSDRVNVTYRQRISRTTA